MGEHDTPDLRGLLQSAPNSRMHPVPRDYSAGRFGDQLCERLLRRRHSRFSEPHQCVARDGLERGGRPARHDHQLQRRPVRF